MNAVEIEEAVSDLVIQPFDPDEFPFQFLEAFGNKETTLKRLRKGSSNRTDVDGAVLQRSNIHILATAPGETEAGLKALLESPKTAQQKAKFIFATDGIDIQAIDLTSDMPLSCAYTDLPTHFGFLLPLAGITTVSEIKNNPIDIKATGRLDKLYVALLQDERNKNWAQEKNREQFNHFMAQLIFCFFAEDTGIFEGDDLFTLTVEKMSHGNPDLTHEIITTIFAAMNHDPRKGDRKDVRPYADKFPYVNGGLFGGPDDGSKVEVPIFNKMARTYLIRAGELDWTAINPDIFGSMIQAVADDEERGELGMHYTSVPNILKVLTSEGRMLRVADLVEDERDREQVMASLKDPRANENRDWVDIIIALGMAKEGFDWIWCEHALTVGYRSSLTEIVQIIGRSTRDAPGKTHARFTNLIAEPDASEGAVTDAINDTLKAIAASLLMEQVLIPNFKFTPKRPVDQAAPKDGFDYGEGGFDKNGTNIGVREGDQAAFHIEIAGLKEPTTDEGKRVCEEDIKELVAAVLQDKPTVEQGLFNLDAIPEETTVVRTMNIVRQRYPNLPDEDQEAARQRVVAAMNMIEMAKKGTIALGSDTDDLKANTQLLEGIRKFAMDVRTLDVDLIDSINPFQSAFSILSKTMDEKTLRQLQGIITAKKVTIPYEEARTLAVRALAFKKERGRSPSITSTDAWERKMAEGIAALAKHTAKNAQ